MATKNKASVKQRKPILTPEETKEFTKFVYPFENMAFEGGGSKGSAYGGTIKVLEEIGVWSNLKRFSGASAGAIVAMWAALGYNSEDIQKFLDVDQQPICYDARFGKLSVLPNLRKHFGINPGKKILKWLGEAVAQKMGNPDATFSDLYRKTGKELCVVTVNVNQLDCEYCHVKTTPNMPIRIAVRMSSAIPGVLAPVKYALHGPKELFCDGGLFCNYPIHVYDGWYLSMKPEDNFLKRIPDLKDVSSFWDSKFGTEPNRKTFGILLYSESEPEMFKFQLNERTEKYIENKIPIPDSRLAKKRVMVDKTMSKTAEKHEQTSAALAAFLRLLQDHDVDESGTTSREELKKALDEAGPKFTKEQRELLFDSKPTDELFDEMDTDGDGEITVSELIAFAEQRGWELRQSFRGFESRKIKSASGFFGAVIETLLLNMKRIYMKGADFHRTIGINTSYLDTLDFDMQPADKTFLMQQGKIACIAFLRYHIENYELEERSVDGSIDEADTNGDENKPGFVKTNQGFVKFFSLRKRLSSTNFFRKRINSKNVDENIDENIDYSETDGT